LAVAAATAASPGGAEPGAPLDPAEIGRRIPETVEDRAGWARDVAAALAAAGRTTDPDSVCSVLAIVGQVSGFTAAVPLDRFGKYDFDGALVRRLGAARARLVRAALARLPGAGGSLHTRLATARDESELDHAFRELLGAAWTAAPALTAVADRITRFRHGLALAELNPVATAGAMQVSVAWAARRTATPPARLTGLRDRLYTRAGGLELGVARLFAADGRDPEPRFRFADYNAGLYASRNAAFQEQLASLTGAPLVLDGDLARYDRFGRRQPASATSAALGRFAAGRTPPLGGGAILRALELEKSAGLETTPAWRAVRAAWRERHGAEPRYARMPAIVAVNPRTGRENPVARFAEHVEARYRLCLAGRDVGRGRRPPE
jgi:hypothetical protein